MTDNRQIRVLTVAGLALLIALVWGFRYDVKSHAGGARFLVLDRWTGTVHDCGWRKRDLSGWMCQRKF
jgi:hypothetical protein